MNPPGPPQHVSRGVFYLRSAAALQILLVLFPSIFMSLREIAVLLVAPEKEMFGPELFIIFDSIRLLWVTIIGTLAWSQSRGWSLRPGYMLCCEVMKTGMVATPYVRIGGGLLTPFLKDVTKSYILLERIYVGTMFGLPLMFAIGLWIYISFSSEHLGDNGMVEEEPLLGYENGIHMRTLLVG